MKEINIIDFGLMGKQISALFYLLGYEIGVYNKSKLNIYEFEKQIKLLQRKIDFSNFNAGKINICQHIEDLKNSLTIESLNEDLNLKMCAENFDQVDSIGYILHAWMKYPKFGHACASDYAARFVRYGLLSRKEAIELVQKRDHKLDNKCVEDFCNFIGISKTTFWKIVEKHYNMDLFYKNDFGEFKLKNKLQ